MSTSRLSACTLPIPEGATIDEASGLTEGDLVLILRALHRTRKHVAVETITMEEMGQRCGNARPSVPITFKAPD